MGCVLHKASLATAEVEERTGFRVTTPLRTLVDVATGAISHEQLEKAVAEALTRGLVRRTKLLTAARKDPRLHRIMEIFEESSVNAT